MKALALADFGSTYTKVSLVEAGTGVLLGQGQAPTTSRSDVMEGYDVALTAATRLAPFEAVVAARRAASSAGGGLRVSAVGLVEDLTAAAARQAALNAGARVELVQAGRLGPTDVARLREVDPEVILFAGGTDGGAEDLVRSNAQAVIGAGLGAFVIVACNAVVSAEIAAGFRAAGIDSEAVPNVMPQIGELDVEPARRALSRVFLSHVIEGKGLSSRPEFREMVAMPTPEAVLVATQLIAGSAGRLAGAGDVVVVDIGGATTDVHSAVADVNAAGLDEALLPVLPVVRTVEGDLGMRSGARGCVEADRTWLLEQDDHLDLDRVVETFLRDPASTPVTAHDRRVDQLVATSCATHALGRHCGHLVTSVRPNSTPRVHADGPDLRAAAVVIGTGGALVHGDSGVASLATAVARQGARVLAPRGARILLDSSYVLSAVGLLDGIDPAAAEGLLSRHLLGSRPERGRA